MTSNYLNISLFSFSFLFIFSPISLTGQQRSVPDKWLGLHNVYYQNRTKMSRDSTPGVVRTRVDNDDAFSLGLYYRLVKDNNSYHQFDLIELGFSTEEGRTEIDQGNPDFIYVLGRVTKTSNIRFGYRRGKLFSLRDRLTADVAVGGFPTYTRINSAPLSSGGFPKRETWLGLGLSLHTGLNYQIHPKVNVGYSFVPLSGRLAWYEERIENPILIESQKRSRETRMDVDAFKDVLAWQNIHIRYVMKPKKKRRRRRR